MTPEPPLQPTNLVLRTSQGGRKHEYPVGKVIPHPQHPDRWIVHENVKPNWVRVDVGDDGFGINDAVVRYAVAHGIDAFYFYLAEYPGPQTYWIELETVLQQGVRHRAPGYGYMWNIPSGTWHVRRGRLPNLLWVKDEVVTYLYATERESRLPPLEPPPPTHVQGELFDADP